MVGRGVSLGEILGLMEGVLLGTKLGRVEGALLGDKLGDSEREGDIVGEREQYLIGPP
jgi:hypothetical protein